MTTFDLTSLFYALSAVLAALAKLTPTIQAAAVIGRLDRRNAFSSLCLIRKTRCDAKPKPRFGSFWKSGISASAY
jgi:hypothetical protein